MLEVFQITKWGCLHFIQSEINYDECWRYVGPAYWINDYPIINRYNKNWIASRFTWFIFTGRDYYGKEIHHKCKTRDCINPTHLEELSARKHRKFHRKNT